MNNYGEYENPYEAPRSQANYMPQQSNETLSFWKWLGLLLLTDIPLVGFITMVVLSFNKKNDSLKHWAWAGLTWALIFGFINAIFNLME